MPLSIFDLFKIGIGPSSSHTVGPMRAARRFARELESSGCLELTTELRVDLYGSLGLTGKGHASDRAVLLGLEDERPEEVDTDAVEGRIAAMAESGVVRLLGRHPLPFRREDIVFHRRETLPGHPNGMCYVAVAESGQPLLERTYYSIGGGFVVDEDAVAGDRLVEDDSTLPFAFSTGEELLAACQRTGLRVSELMLENESSWRSREEVRAGLLGIWGVMEGSVQRGCEARGELPGKLQIPRRARALRDRLMRDDDAGGDPLV
ncbi:MAG: L-serine ammonia-lyase, iron-sulfur-dependent, subunit alpha, partial [Proteobacteria bacterium]|nr:L-serine ammonia-lyase, iron-sulfur-dependent, subunit alpha [Pseudomonadota bacterium]